MLITMRKGSVQAGRKEQKKGFTLTEIAIVLGIIGLILGAIWVAAAAVYTNMRSSRTSSQLLTIAQNVRTMYATSSAVDPAADMAIGGGAAGASPDTYPQSGVFPSDTNVNGVINDSWGGNIGIRAATSVVANDAFSIFFTNVPAQACINLLVSNTGTGTDPSLFNAVATAPGASAAFAFNAADRPPISASRAQALCNNRQLSDLRFSFRLRG